MEPNPPRGLELLLELEPELLPEVPVEVLNRVLPRPDEGAVAPPPRPSRGLGGHGYGAPSGFLDEAAPKIAGITPAAVVQNAAQVVFRVERPVSLAPLYPSGFAEPDRQPRYPQSLTEIMAGRFAIDSQTFDMPGSLDEARVGPATALEIRWVHP